MKVECIGTDIHSNGCCVSKYNSASREPEINIVQRHFDYDSLLCAMFVLTLKILTFENSLIQGRKVMR